MNKIITSATTHPSLLQFYLQKLINYISKKITKDYRKITEEDVNYILSEYWSGIRHSGEITFTQFVDATLSLTIEPIHYLIIDLMVIEDVCTYDDLFYKLNTYGLKMTKDDVQYHCVFMAIAQILNLEGDEKIKFKNEAWKSFSFDKLQNDMEILDRHIEDAKNQMEKINGAK
ncbi:MAG: hypothetical protein GX452_04745 [Ignavibacteriales bacterium]|nr:hypothetical protein [Ignavibacteriales bacterium]